MYNRNMEQILYILTGNTESGKTRWLQSYIKFLEDKEKSYFGVLAPGVWNNGKKQGIDNILLPINKLIHLAVRKPYKSEGFSKKWNFSQDAIDEVNEHFKSFSECDYLIVDELGPLELCDNKGLTNAICLIENLKFSKAIIVVRPHLVDTAKEKFSNCNHIEVLDISDLSESNHALL